MKKLATYLLSAGLALLAVSSAHAQAMLYGIGDLSGGNIQSVVNDATKVGGVIYAVGSSSAVASNNDRAVLWTYNTSNSSTSLTALSDFNANSTSGAIATAITPDGASIAASLHNSGSTPQVQGALVSSSALASPTALGVLSGTGLTAPNSFANGISDDGTVLYGSAQYTSTAPSSRTQLVRYTNTGNPSITPIAFPSGVTNMVILNQAAVSSDGNKVVGVANTVTTGFRTAGTAAFIYINSDPGNGGSPSLDTVSLGSSGTNQIPSSTWTAGLALNSAGTLGLLGSNSTTYANGGLVIYSDSPPTFVDLGSPNSAYSLTGGGSLNADGSLVSATFNTLANGTGTNLGYIHNANGWFQLDSVASALGANMTGWSNLNIFGMSPDGTLVWGNGNHSGNTEGFVLDLSASGGLSSIPEPSTYAAFAGLGALGLAAWRRRQLRLRA